MPDPNVTAQTIAAMEQAHAAWAQVWVGAGSALATFAAVAVALASPWLTRRRRLRFEREVLFTAAAAIVRLHLTLETALVSMRPEGALSLVRIARKRLEIVLPVSDDYAMLTCLLALAPMLTQTEEQLERWCEHMKGNVAFSIDGFRQGMQEQAAKANAILGGFGSRHLMARLAAVTPFEP